MSIYFDCIIWVVMLQRLLYPIAKHWDIGIYRFDIHYVSILTFCLGETVLLSIWIKEKFNLQINILKMFVVFFFSWKTIKLQITSWGIALLICSTICILILSDGKVYRRIETMQQFEHTWSNIRTIKK